AAHEVPELRGAVDGEGLGVDGALQRGGLRASPVAAGAKQAPRAEDDREDSEPGRHQDSRTDARIPGHRRAQNANAWSMSLALASASPRGASPKRVSINLRMEVVS